MGGGERRAAANEAMAAMPPLSLAELLDAAIGTPELGAVNFTALHSLLRALLQHLGLHRLPAPTPPRGQPPQPAPGPPGGSAAPDVGQERSEARDGDATEAPSVPRDLLEAISGVKAAQSRMAEDIRGIKELLGLVSCPQDGHRAPMPQAGEQRGPRGGGSPESNGEAAGSQSAASESSGSPESGEEGTERGGTPRGTQPAPRTGKGTPGTQPRSPGARAGTRRAPATPERRAGAAPDRTGTAGAGATAPGTQPGVPGTQAAVLGTQPGSPGTQTSTPGAQPGSPGTQITTLGAQPGSPGTQITTLGAQPGSPGTHVTGLESPGTHGTTPGTQPGSPGAPATTLGTQPGSPSPPTTTTGMQTGSPSAPTTTTGTQPAPPWSQGGGGGGGGVQPSPPSTAPSLPGTEATPGAWGTQAGAARPEAQLPPAAQPLSPTAQGPQMSPDTAAGSTCPVPGSSAAGLAGALQRVAELGRLCATLQGQVARLEATKSDRAELEELRLLFPEGDQESIATLLADLRGHASSLQGLAGDLHGQGEKIKQLQDALGELGLAGAAGKSGGSLGALLQELRTELRELREQQDAAKATLEQLVATTAGHLQEQLDELRSLLGGAGPDTSPASSPAGTEPVPAECPVCSADVGAQLGQLLRRYEQLQELVDSVLVRQATGKASRQLPGRRWEDEELLKSIQASILQVQGDCEKLGSVTGNLVDDHHQKQKDIEALFQSLERLQKEKADKEELVLEIEVKADRAALASKVSCAQFDAAVEQLNKTIEDTLSKVTGQEQGWHRVQQKLVEELGSKLDRLELAPLRQQLEERCRSILRQLEERAPQAEADDAAGIRKQLLAHFHCVSCDRPLRMAVPGPHIVTIPPMPPLPSRLSTRPHAVFEPEHLRQHSRGTRWSCWARTGTSTRGGGTHGCLPSWGRTARGGTSPSCPQGSVAPRTSCPRGPTAPCPCSAARAPPGSRSSVQRRPTAASPRDRGSPRPRGRRRTGERPRQRRGAGGARLGAPPGHHTGGPARSNKGRWMGSGCVAGVGLAVSIRPLGSWGGLVPCCRAASVLTSLDPQLLTSLRPYSLTSLRPYSLTSICPYIHASLHPYILISLYPYKPCLLTSLHPCFPTSLHPYIPISLQTMPPYILTSLHPYKPCLLTSLHPCFPTSLPPYVPTSFHLSFLSSLHPYSPMSLCPYILTSIHPYIHTSSHPCILISIHPYILTSIVPYTPTSLSPYIPCPYVLSSARPYIRISLHPHLLTPLHPNPQPSWQPQHPLHVPPSPPLHRLHLCARGGTSPIPCCRRRLWERHQNPRRLRAERGQTPTGLGSPPRATSGAKPGKTQRKAAS
ncbi:glutamine-rich protein 2 isoform X2 [Anser cygnoides]|uniref:glutamine-rich protein 2 isoform X2 n=1 Tax=Anser cygnoides TaxID=8845 RepID=UPI0034D301A2